MSVWCRWFGSVWGLRFFWGETEISMTGRRHDKNWALTCQELSAGNVIPLFVIPLFELK